MQIDDSAFPVPTPLPAFSAIAVDAGFRNALGQYCLKTQSNAAFNFTTKLIASVPAAELVQPVTLTLVVTAPTP